MSRYRMFDRSKIKLRPLGDRENQLTLKNGRCLAGVPDRRYDHPDFDRLIAAMRRARQESRPIVWMIGAHLIKQGLSGYLIELMNGGYVSHLATNGAAIIHDYELALQGGTSEDVARYIKQGDFGMWADTGKINEIIREAAQREEGLGEAVGRVIEQSQLPNRAHSLFGSGYRRGIPVTAHVGIGCDIIHQHANCDGAAVGDTSYRDFLIFAASLENLEGGVFLNVGSAVTGPEVYLKALSMVRNVGRQRARSIRKFTTAVFDLVPLPDDFRDGTAPKTHAQYYYRPWKTILVRTVADGGTSYYFQGDHNITIPSLHHLLLHDEMQ